MGGRQPTRGHFLPQQPRRQPVSPPRRAKALSSITLQILLEGCLLPPSPARPDGGARGGHLVPAAALGDCKRPWGVQPWMPESHGGLDLCPAPVRGSPGAMPWQHWGPESILQCLPWGRRSHILHPPSRAHILHPTSCALHPTSSVYPLPVHSSSPGGSLPAGLAQTLTRSAPTSTVIRAARQPPRTATAFPHSHHHTPPCTAPAQHPAIPRIPIAPGATPATPPAHSTHPPLGDLPLQPSAAHMCAHLHTRTRVLTPASMRPPGDAPQVMPPMGDAPRVMPPMGDVPWVMPPGQPGQKSGRCRSLPAWARRASGGGSRCRRVPGSASNPRSVPGGGWEARPAKGYLKGRGTRALPVPSAGSRGCRPIFTAAAGRALAHGPAARGPAASSSSFPGGAGGYRAQRQGWPRRAPAGSSGSGCSAGPSRGGRLQVAPLPPRGGASRPPRGSARPPPAAPAAGAPAPRGADATLPGLGGLQLGHPLPLRQVQAGGRRRQAGRQEEAEGQAGAGRRCAGGRALAPLSRGARRARALPARSRSAAARRPQCRRSGAAASAPHRSRSAAPGPAAAAPAAPHPRPAGPCPAPLPLPSRSLCPQPGRSPAGFRRGLQ